MNEPEVEAIIQRTLKKHPGSEPRIISDNGPEFIRLTGISHVKTSPFYPHCNGKLERWHGTLTSEDFRNKTPQNIEEARQVVGDLVKHYNGVRLHSAIGYITPYEKPAGKDKNISENRDSKLEAARRKRLRA